MSVYIVTWDLNKEGAAYETAREKLLDIIETFENTHNPRLRSTRFISTEMSANELYTHLRLEGELDENDRIAVVKMTGTTNTTNDGNLGRNVWAWINLRV